MKRRLFTAGSVLSLMLALSTVVLWAESYGNFGVGRNFSIRVATKPLILSSINGHFYVTMIVGGQALRVAPLKPGQLRVPVQLGYEVASISYWLVMTLFGATSFALFWLARAIDELVGKKPNSVAPMVTTFAPAANDARSVGRRFK